MEGMGIVFSLRAPANALSTRIHFHFGRKNGLRPDKRFISILEIISIDTNTPENAIHMTIYVRWKCALCTADNAAGHGHCCRSLEQYLASCACRQL